MRNKKSLTLDWIFINRNFLTIFLNKTDVLDRLTEFTICVGWIFIIIVKNQADGNILPTFFLFLLSVLPSSLLGKRPLAGKRFVVKITDFSNNKVDDWIFYFPTAESSFIILAVVNCNNNVWTGFCGVCWHLQTYNKRLFLAAFSFYFMNKT